MPLSKPKSVFLFGCYLIREYYIIEKCLVKRGTRDSSLGGTVSDITVVTAREN